MESFKIVYMDLVDWQDEVGETSDGKHRIYDSIEQLKSDRKCWEECGIIGLKLEVVEIVSPSKY